MRTPPALRRATGPVVSVERRDVVKKHVFRMEARIFAFNVNNEILCQFAAEDTA